MIILNAKKQFFLQPCKLFSQKLIPTAAKYCKKPINLLTFIVASLVICWKYDKYHVLLHETIIHQ